jgi:hypothetical protein
MSTNPDYVRATPVHFWCCGIKAWQRDRKHYRIIPIMRDGTEGPPIELGREMWEKLERMASGD